LGKHKNTLGNRKLTTSSCGSQAYDIAVSTRKLASLFITHLNCLTRLQIPQQPVKRGSITIVVFPLFEISFVLIA
jgi:hypothetical protein